MLEENSGYNPTLKLGNLSSALQDVWSHALDFGLLFFHVFCLDVKLGIGIE